jgi:uroporphyrinogen decarboxylase
MESREIVARTLDFEQPERIARSFRGSDLVGVAYTSKTYATDWVEVDGGVWEHLDEWGNTWRRLDRTSKGEVAKGILDDLEDAERYEFPDFSNLDDYQAAAQGRRNNPEKWVMGQIPGFAFNIARKLRRLDNYLADILIDRPRISALHDRIDALLEDMIHNYAAVGVDSIFFPEDWGTQNQTLVSPNLWMQEFFPRFQKLCRLSHDLGLKVFMHSCGQIEAIMPGLIDAGIDLFQFDQPGCMGSMSSRRTRNTPR